MGDGSRLAQAHQLPERGRLEGALAGEDFVEDQTQRVDVAPGGDLLARQLLRSHVGRRSSARLLALDARGNSRQPKIDRKSTRLNSSHGYISYAVFCLKKKTT